MEKRIALGGFKELQAVLVLCRRTVIYICSSGNEGRTGDVSYPAPPHRSVLEELPDTALVLGVMAAS